MSELTTNRSVPQRSKHVHVYVRK